MIWQFNWRVWHWPWYKEDIEPILITEIRSCWAGIGPFQFHWYRYF